LEINNAAAIVDGSAGKDQQGRRFVLSSVPIDRTLLVLFAILRITGIFDLKIVYTKLLSTQLADILVVGVPEKTIALVIEIVTPCQRNNLLSALFYSACLKTRWANRLPEITQGL